MSLLAALLITWCAWELLISGTVFQCIDDGIDVGFWMSADTHRAAGDRILAGWTWEKVEAVNGAFRLGFFVLWVGASFVSFRVLKSFLKEPTSSRGQIPPQDSEPPLRLVGDDVRSL